MAAQIAVVIGPISTPSAAAASAGREHRFPREDTEPLMQVPPPRDRAGHGDGLPADVLHVAVIAAGELDARRVRRRSAAPVVRGHLPGCGHHRHDVTAEAGGDRLDDTHHSVCGDGRIDRRPAQPQRGKRRLRRRRVAAGHRDGDRHVAAETNEASPLSSSTIAGRCSSRLR